MLIQRILMLAVTPNHYEGRLSAVVYSILIMLTAAVCLRAVADSEA